MDGSLSAWLGVRWKALRAFSFPLSALPVLVGVAIVQPFAGWRVDVVIASALSAVLLHAAANLLNDYFDFRSGVDRRLEGDEDRPGRLLVKGVLTPGQVMAEALVCLALAMPLGAYLVYRCGPELLWFCGAGMLCVYAYTGPPFRLKYRALGEVVIFAVFGPLVVVGAAYAHTGRLELGAFLVSIPVGLATTAVLLGDNIRDVEEDGAAKIHTLATLLGPRLTMALYVTCVLIPPLAVAGLVALRVLGPGSLASLVSLVPAGFLLRKVMTTPRLPDVDARTAKNATIFMVTLLVGSTLL
ncbi:MAG: UbiA family prenyltransferase [Planctomycetota bacterium]|jgi:1,4-dihydroxy-2-naphthoate octaprenyltransferase